jgi:hypothetical protein
MSRTLIVWFVALSWLDWFGVAADVITFVGVPTLGWSTWRLWQDQEKDRAEEAERRMEATHRQVISQGCVDFEDTRQKVGINLIPFERLIAIPRPGDFVMLPGETRDGRNYGAAEYEVESVSFSFQEAPEITDQPCPAVPSKIIVYVHRRERKELGDDKL